VRLDVQKINHNYVTRLVIFSIFLFKNYRKEEKVYHQMIVNFLRRKVGYKIDLEIQVGPKYTLQEQRDNIIESIINNEDVSNLNLVVANYKTGLKEVSIQIDLNEEDKYEEYLYS
jgi:hypothetical protein